MPSTSGVSRGSRTSIRSRSSKKRLRLRRMHNNGCPARDLWSAWAPVLFSHPSMRSRRYQISFPQLTESSHSGQYYKSFIFARCPSPIMMPKNNTTDGKRGLRRGKREEKYRKWQTRRNQKEEGIPGPPARGRGTSGITDPGRDHRLRTCRGTAWWTYRPARLLLIFRLFQENQEEQ